MSELQVFDFHVHGGDVRRVSEIREYMKSEGLEGMVLLSMPLSGFPDGPPEPVNLNLTVLESKRQLNSGTDKSPEVYAFGSLDNSDLLKGRRRDWDPVAQVAAMAEAGFDGLKLWEGKPELAAALGLMPDDRRLVDACREAGKQGIPVLFHIGDPPEFWSNESGKRSLSELEVPGFKALINSSARLCQAAPDTTFVFPHLLFLGGNLVEAAAFLNNSPNAMFDLAPGNYFYEPLSRNPEQAAEFFKSFRNRILFGSDAFFFPLDFKAFSGESLPGNQKRCRRLLDFLSSSETVDNPYPLVPEDRKTVQGLKLPESTLTPILQNNARRILPAIPRVVTT
ncbi:MAG: hypothetical protein DRP60_08370 [Spirochaetes bacterium]|nr:MAG: hypothetical protein DRP60_08370 [Spirochaetota bacterium]